MHNFSIDSSLLVNIFVGVLLKSFIGVPGSYMGERISGLQYFSDFEDQLKACIYVVAGKYIILAPFLG
jgi:hypothetical protein